VRNLSNDSFINLEKNDGKWRERDLYCVNCGHHQREGNFCAKCGTALGGDLGGAVQTMGRVAARAKSQPNVYVEKVKAVSKVYWRYFLDHLKYPVGVFNQGEKECIHGIVTILMMAISVGLAMFVFMKGIASPFLDETSSLLVIGGSVVYILISAAIVLGSLYLTTVFLGPEQSIKKLLGIYGAHLIPFTILVIIALIFLLLKVNYIGNILLLFALLFAFFIVPLYILTKLLTQDDPTLDPLYSVVVYIVIFSILFAVCIAVFGDSVMGGIMRLNY
jgi:hypothetical protein